MAVAGLDDSAMTLGEFAVCVYRFHCTFCSLCRRSECSVEPRLYAKLKEVLGWR